MANTGRSDAISKIGHHIDILALALIVVAALGLRLYGLDWDGGHLFHPDERHILMVTHRIALPEPFSLSELLSPRSPLNPASFAYGSFSFYFLRIATGALALLGELLGLDNWRGLQSFEGFSLVGRSASALFDIGTIGLVYLLGRRLYGWRAGILGAAFVALSVQHIQLSHFYASDTLMSFFVLASLCGAIAVSRPGGLRWAALAGFAVGLALSTKVSSLPVLGAVGAAYGLRVFARTDVVGNLRLRPPNASELREGIEAAIVTGLCTVGTFILVQPYAIIDFPTFIRHVAEQGAMVRGYADFPYTRQFADRAPYLYFIGQLTVFGLGLPLGVAALGGWLFTIVRALRRPSHGDIVLLAWVLPYFLLTGSFYVQFPRYLLPITPILCLFAARALLAFCQWLDYHQSTSLGADLAGCPKKSGSDSRADHSHLSDTRSQDVPGYGPHPDLAPEGGRVNPSTHGDFREPASASPQSVASAAYGGTFQRSTQLTSRETPPTRSVEQASVAAPPSRNRGFFGRVLIATILVLTALWALAFISIYSRPHTAVSASEWIYANVPPGSSIAREHWEEGLPVSMVIDGVAYSERSQRYRINTLNLYEQDSEAKLTEIVEQLVDSDYIVLFSNRLYGTIPRLPERYPLTAEYYRLLFGENLGFELVAAFTSYPGLPGITFLEDTLTDPGLPTPSLLADKEHPSMTVNVGRPDESFSVYDHPKVLIFQKTDYLTSAELLGLLSPSLPSSELMPGTNRGSADGRQNLMIAVDAREAMEAGGTYREIFDHDGLTNRWPIPTWIVLLQVVGIAAMPVAFLTFGGLADRGYLAAKTLGLLGLAWLSWMGVNLGIVSGTRSSALLGLATLLAIGSVVGYCQRQELAAFLRSRWRSLAIGEMLFWFAFALFLAIRLANPDLWHPARGGEKPMDLAYLMAAIKSVNYPPYDPWFAGGYLNYYYYGQIMMGTLIKLSGIAPTTAYNLAIPSLFALTVVGAYTVGFNLVTRSGASEHRAYIAGIGAAVFVCLLGNLGGGGQIIAQLADIGGWHYQSIVPGLGHVVGAVYGLTLLTIGGGRLDIPTDWYWHSTRVIPGTINEFPFFTFLYADMHAHLIALPVTLVALGLAVNVVKMGMRSKEVFWSPVTLPVILVSALVIGSLWPTNAWDYPTYLGLFALAAVVPWYLSPRHRPLDLLGTALGVGVVAALSYVLYLPFHQHYQSFYTSVTQVPDRSPVLAYLAIHGLFLAATLTFLGLDLSRHCSRTGAWRIARLALRYWYRPHRLLAIRRALVRRTDDRGVLALYAMLATLAIAVALVVLRMELIAVLLPLLVVVIALGLSQSRPAEETLVLALIGVGLALGIATEIVAVEGDIGRMNTVFKFYLQVWVVWGIASAAALVMRWDDLLRLRRHLPGRIWLGVLMILVVLAAIYPPVGTWARVRDRFDTAIPPTLNGTAYARQAVYWDDGRRLVLANDLAAIEWLQDNVVGSPVVLEGQTPLYRWGSRVSVYTGLPTVIGWDWHQIQQRWEYRDLVQERGRDVRTIYVDPSSERALQLLRRYRVSYIFVGEVEKAYYPAEGLDKFDQMVGRDLELVYDQDEVRIYRVHPPSYASGRQP